MEHQPITSDDVQHAPHAGFVPDDAPSVSVAVPVMNESGNVVPLLEEIHGALQGEDSFEVIFVDDGSTDSTVEELLAERERFPMLRVVRHDVNCGQSAAIRTGVLAARAPIVVTLDGDRQNDPADIPKVLEALRDPSAPDVQRMVSGKRVKRQDSAMKKAASKLANAIRSKLLNDGTADTGCGLKAFYRDSFLKLPYFDHMHRYIPALMQREGFTIGFVDVNARQRMHGQSKYGVLDRLLVSLSDIIGVIWLNNRCHLPGKRTEL